MMDILIAVECFTLVALGVWLGRSYQRGCESDKRQAFAVSPEFKALSYAEQRGALVMWDFLKERP